MTPVQTLAAVLDERVRQAVAVALPDADGLDPQLRRSDRADWQANGILGLAKPLRADPRELAELVVAALPAVEPIAAAEVSGPGFVNLTLTDSAIITQLGRRACDARLGVPRTGSPCLTVLDYSQPNIAKEMHVGHLRSTVIGDALARLLEHQGDTVVRHNHLGDWGTQFGMLIEHLQEHPGQLAPFDDAGAAMSHLNHLYRDARARFDSDPNFADRARRRVVALQVGDPETVAAWRKIVEESKVYFNAVYERLDVLLTDADAVGESFYNGMLADVCADLEASGIASRHEGALCVFFGDITGPEGEPSPLIVQKSDGGYGYATTDLAAIRFRVGSIAAKRLLYVVDARQELHFRMVFETARRAGWLPEDVSSRHVAFGTVLGGDGRPFKTRSGETVRLIDLLDEAVRRASIIVAEKSPQLTPDELADRAREVGIGAVKYADLSTGRTRDYVFDLDRMISLTGNTGVYLQYAHARIQSLLRKSAGHVPTAHPELALEPAERALGLFLDDYSDSLLRSVEACEPHRLCSYLYELAQAFTTFYETCPVLGASTKDVRENRLLFCYLTRETLRSGMNLLGIAAPDRL